MSVTLVVVDMAWAFSTPLSLPAIGKHGVVHQRDLVTVGVFRAIRAVFGHLLGKRVDRHASETALLEEVGCAREYEKFVDVELRSDLLEVAHKSLADPSALELGVYTK